MSDPGGAGRASDSPLKLPILGLCLLAGFCVIRFPIFRYVFIALVLLLVCYLIGTWASRKLNRKFR